MLWCYQGRRGTALWWADYRGHKEVSAYLRLDVTPQQVLSPPLIYLSILHIIHYLHFTTYLCGNMHLCRLMLFLLSQKHGAADQVTLFQFLMKISPKVKHFVFTIVYQRQREIDELTSAWQREREAQQDKEALEEAARKGDLAAVQRLVPLVGRNAPLNSVSAPLMTQ